MEKMVNLGRMTRKFSFPHQFLNFGIVGSIGFFVDVGTLWIVGHVTNLDFYSARGISYLLAATTTWALNRHYTFVEAQRRSALQQWLCFLIINLGGGLVNYLTYVILIAFTPLTEQLPTWLGLTIAVGAGSLAGLTVNFFTSRQWVFN